MPKFLRKIKGKNWTEKQDYSLQTTDDKICGDAIGDFGQSNFSLWLVDDNQSNLEPIIASLAQDVGTFEYLLIDGEKIKEYFPNKIENTPGQNCKIKSIGKSYHYDIKNLKAPDIVLLVKLFSQFGNLGTKDPEDVARFLKMQVDVGTIKLNRTDRVYRSMADYYPADFPLPTCCR